MKSLRGLPKITCAGDRPVSLSGVFLCCNSALSMLSLSISPNCDILEFMSLFIDFTAISALQLECGKYAEETLCSICKSFNICWNSPDMYSGPPSVDRVSGMP